MISDIDTQIGNLWELYDYTINKNKQAQIMFKINELERKRQLLMNQLEENESLVVDSSKIHNIIRIVLIYFIGILFITFNIIMTSI